ncbi:hypothetical protein ACIBCN_43300 [Nocardia sp. NPDC051052]|uniref:hypothetical protein n=1 Tax=Nocardia sp. NPDC051052 TaxID=3364322 RepID=UPI0037AB1532
MLRLLAVVACGTRTVIDAMFGTYGISELAYTPKLLECLGEGMLLLADHNFAAAALIGQIAETKTELLIRDKSNRVMPMIEDLPDGSWLALKGPVVIRVIDAEIEIAPAGGPARRERYPGDGRIPSGSY